MKQRQNLQKLFHTRNIDKSLCSSRTHGYIHCSLPGSEESGKEGDHRKSCVTSFEKPYKDSQDFPRKTFNAVVLSQGGKVTSIHKNWLNVEYTSPETHAGLQDCIDFKSQVDHWEICDESGSQSTGLIAFEDTSENITGDFAEAKQRTKTLE